MIITNLPNIPHHPAKSFHYDGEASSCRPTTPAHRPSLPLITDHSALPTSYTNLCTIGIRRPIPKALLVTRSPGAAC